MKKKKIRKQNGVAKALRHPSFKMQVIPNKKKSSKNQVLKVRLDTSKAG